MTASAEEQRLPRLHLVTDDEVLGRPGFAGTAEQLLRHGGSRVALHVRGPGLSGRELWDLGSRCSSIARETGTPLIVNDRIDHAIAFGAAGVQLGRSSMPVADARRLLGEGRWIGASVHDADGARSAAADGADFVIAGTLFRTPTHPGRQGKGVAWLHGLRSSGVPVIGIGGISVDRISEVIAAGAAGVAVIRGVWSAADPVAALEAYLAKTE